MIVSSMSFDDLFVFEMCFYKNNNRIMVSAINQFYKSSIRHTRLHITMKAK